MQIRKTIRKGIRKPSNVKRIVSIEEQMTLFEMFELFMNYKKTEGLSTYTIKDYYTHFRYLTEFIGGDLSHEEVTDEIFREYLGYLLHDHGISPITVNVRIRTIRAFLRHAFQEGWINKPIHERFKPVKTPEDEIEGFTVAEVKSLFNEVDDSRYVGFRDKVMMYVMLDSMVRVSELLKMRRSNVDLKAGQIKLEPHETKMKRARTVPISTKTIKLLGEYISETSDFEEDLLFLTYDGRQISDNTWRKRLTELGELAGIKDKRVSPHTFRHTGALFYILNGGDPFSLQKILGHTDMSMVRKYIQMTNSDIKRQHNSFTPLKNIF